MHSNKLIKFVFFFLLLLWCTAIFAEYLIPYLGRFAISIPFIKKSFSFLCHQEEAKLIVSGGCHSMVCSRCAGIYLGALLSSLFNLIWPNTPRITNKLLVLSSLPMILDVAGTTLSIYTYSKITAFSTGILFGVVTFLYFYNAFTDLLTELREKE